jgi:copper(I)-binding protein
MRTRKAILAIAMTLPLVAALGVACSDDSEGEVGIEVSEVFARAALDRGGAYMVIENKGGEADALVAANAEIAGETELHETITEGASTRMEPVDRIEIPADGTVELKPGGFHVMLQELESAIEVGDEIPLTLTFEKAGDVQVTAVGKDYAEMPEMEGGMETEGSH